MFHPLSIGFLPSFYYCDTPLTRFTFQLLTFRLLYLFTHYLLADDYLPITFQHESNLAT